MQGAIYVIVLKVLGNTSSLQYVVPVQLKSIGKILLIPDPVIWVLYVGGAAIRCES